jgi:hypothetical protein
MLHHPAFASAGGRALEVNWEQHFDRFIGRYATQVDVQYLDPEGIPLHLTNQRRVLNITRQINQARPMTDGRFHLIAGNLQVHIGLFVTIEHRWHQAAVAQPTHPPSTRLLAELNL